MSKFKRMQYRYMVGDFETTVYDGQTHTEVWASGVVDLWSEDVIIHHSIGETFEYLKNLKENIIIILFWILNLKWNCQKMISLQLYGMHVFVFRGKIIRLILIYGLLN